MKLPKKSQEDFLEVLKLSKQEGVELGSFGLYLPTEDRVLYTIHPKDLPEGSVVGREKDTRVFALVFQPELVEEIRAFNKGRKESIKLGGENFSQKEGKIIGYHAHPREEDEIAPSIYDRQEMLRRERPVEIVVSAGLEKFWREKPFVAGYQAGYFPEKGNYIKGDWQEFELEEEARKRGLDEETFYQLVECRRKTGLFPAVDFEVLSGEIVPVSCYQGERISR